MTICQLFYIRRFSIRRSSVDKSAFAEDIRRYKEIVESDLLLQMSFCQMITENERLKADRLLENKREVRVASLSAKVCETAHNLLEKYNAAYYKIHKENDDIYFKIENTHSSEDINKIETEFVSLLADLFSLALLQPEKNNKIQADSESACIRILEKLSHISFALPEYRPVANLFSLTCQLKQYGFDLPISIVPEIICQFGLKNTDDVEDIVDLLSGKLVKCSPVKKELCDALFTYDNKKRSVSARQYDMPWHSLLSCLDGFNTSMILYEGWRDAARDIRGMAGRFPCLAEKFELQRLFDHRQPEFFAENSRNDIFSCEMIGNEYRVKADFSEKNDICPVVLSIPPYAGMYFHFSPPICLDNYESLRLNIRTPDQGIERMDIEVKSIPRPDRDKHTYRIVLNNEWKEYVLPFAGMPDHIRSETEQICFVLHPSDFSRGSGLAGRFDIADLRLE